LHFDVNGTNAIRLIQELRSEFKIDFPRTSSIERFEIWLECYLPMVRATDGIARAFGYVDAQRKKPEGALLDIIGTAREFTFELRKADGRLHTMRDDLNPPLVVDRFHTAACVILVPRTAASRITSASAFSSVAP